MALITYKDLCIDVTNEAAMARFWSAATGLRIDPEDGGKLVGKTPEQTIWLNSVPEAKTVKHRVHLDLCARSPEVFADAGRLSEPGQYRWTVFADPEGGEFCVFETQNPSAYSMKDVVVAATEPERIARWWADLFGAVAVDDDGYWLVHGIAGLPFEDFDFVPVPEPKTVKNRIHWDVKLAAGATVGDLIAAGATLIRAKDDEFDWTVLADPEGNEFCVFDH